jgi:hypothetical protein
VVDSPGLLTFLSHTEDEQATESELAALILVSGR